MKVDLTKSKWKVHKNGSLENYPAKISGFIFTDLMNGGVIDNPFCRTNDHYVQWIDKEEWGYTTTFIANKSMLSKNKVDIVFEGIDTFADVFINDSLVWKNKNLFST